MLFLFKEQIQNNYKKTDARKQTNKQTRKQASNQNRQTQHKTNNWLPSAPPAPSMFVANRRKRHRERERERGNFYVPAVCQHDPTCRAFRTNNELSLARAPSRSPLWRLQLRVLHGQHWSASTAYLLNLDAMR